MFEIDLALGQFLQALVDLGAVEVDQHHFPPQPRPAAKVARGDVAVRNAEAMYVLQGAQQRHGHILHRKRRHWARDADHVAQRWSQHFQQHGASCTRFVKVNHLHHIRVPGHDLENVKLLPQLFVLLLLVHHLHGNLAAVKMAQDHLGEAALAQYGLRIRSHRPGR